MLPIEKRVLGLIAMILLCLFLFAAAARAEPAVPCAGVADVLARLEVRFGELTIWQGLTADGQFRMLITAQPSGGSWTALVQRPDGAACLIASGESWAPGGALPAPVGEEG